MKPWACMVTKLHTTMASEPHPSGQTGDCHGCQSHTSPATGSAASLSQLHFLNTSVFSLTKLTSFPAGADLWKLLLIGMVLITFLKIQFFGEFTLH